MSFFYQAFGLIINSEIEIPEFIGIDDTLDVDVVIRFTNLEKKSSILRPDEWFYILDDEIYFEIEKVGRFFIKESSFIEVDPFDGTDQDNIRLFLLGSGFGALFHQRGFLPIHASAVEIGGKAILFAGDSGAGKSTTSYSFYKKGYRIISDDISVIELRNKKPYVISAYPQVKLWDDAIDKLGLKRENHRKLRKGEEKYGVKLPYFNLEDPIELGSVFFLKPSKVSKTNVFEIKSFEKVIQIQKNIYRSYFKKNILENVDVFKKITAIGASVRFYEIERKENSVDEVLNLVKSKINVNKI